MGSTIAEKIIARAAGRDQVSPGETIYVKPDFAATYDFVGTPRTFANLKALGVQRVWDPEKVAAFIDHFMPPRSVEEEEIHVATRNWTKEQGAKLHEREGIGHQLTVDLGYALPGTLLVHGDPMVASNGAVGCLAVGIGGDLLEVYARGETWVIVPASIRFHLTGSLSKGVTGRDLILKIIGDIGPDGALDKVMEFSGPGAESMSIDSRMSLCSLSMFTGAFTAIVSPDAKTQEYVSARTQRPFVPLTSDPDAEYDATYHYDLSALEPQVAVPPDVYLNKPLREVEGTPVDQGYLGSCAGGRLEDLRLAGQILKGKKVAPGFRLNVVPSSMSIMLQAVQEGLIETFVQAGAFVSAPSCDYCYGATQCLADGETAISTGTLNIPGRMGSTKAHIYLASPASVAAASVEGKITDPRRFL